VGDPPLVPAPLGLGGLPEGEPLGQLLELLAAHAGQRRVGQHLGQARSGNGDAVVEVAQQVLCVGEAECGRGDRVSLGAGPTDPLFVAPRSRARLRHLAMVGWLGTVSRRTAVMRPPAAEEWFSTAPTDQWLRRRGLTVTWIGYPYAWPTTTAADAH
jgi:hypothetical protein